ncbi:hypothetical protein NN561_004806 [Cricetulus griseus]
MQPPGSRSSSPWRSQAARPDTTFHKRVSREPRSLLARPPAGGRNRARPPAARRTPVRGRPRARHPRAHKPGAPSPPRLRRGESGATAEQAHSLDEEAGAFLREALLPAARQVCGKARKVGETRASVASPPYSPLALRPPERIM